MTASFRVSGRSGKQIGAVGHRNGFVPGQMVYSAPAADRTYYPAKLSAFDGRTDLSEAFSGITSGENVHNGGDNAYWTGSQVVGTTVDFASTLQSNTGLASIDATGMSNNDVFALTAPAAINPANYSVLEMYIYIDTWATGGTKEVLIDVYNGGASAGTQLALSAYCDITAQASWQLVTIPMADFGITTATIDELRVTCRDVGRGSPPSLFYDDIQFLAVGTTGVLEFTFAPRPEETVEIRGIQWSGVNASKKDIEYNEFWGIPELANGCTLTVRAGGRTAFTLLVRNIYDFASIAPVEIVSTSGASGAIISCVATLQEEGMVLRGEDGDSITVTIRDDLTALSRMTVALEAYYLDYSFEE